MTVYLIHFDMPLGDPANQRGQAQHYIGFTDDLPARIDTHRRGNGAAIMAAVGRAEIGWYVVRVWTGGRDLERKLKCQKNARRLCPICQGGLQLHFYGLAVPALTLVWDAITEVTF